MRNYRLVLILKRGLDKKAVDTLLAEVKKLGGEVKKENLKEMGEKKFAYKIKGEQSGNYIVWEFESEKISPEMDMRLRNNDSILRHLLTRTD